MRYPADHREKTRQRILDAAGIVFRRKGFQAGSVDDVMSEAGLTAGAFYAHFPSKEELFAEAFIQMLQQTRTLRGKSETHLQGTGKLRSIVAKYLSPGHRNLIDQGCPLPPLLADLPRQSEATRTEFQKLFAEIAGELSDLLTQEPREDSAKSLDETYGLLAILVGGLSLSRAVADATFGNRILSACCSLIDRLIPPSVSPDDPPINLK